MNIADILLMRPELILTAQIVLLLIYDLFASDNAKKHFDLVACGLFLVGTVISFLPTGEGELFGGMYVASNMSSVVKAILNIGVLIVFLQSNQWLNSENTLHKKAEVYILLLSTLMGMNFMISAGHFLMFFIGLELASLPLTALIAYDKYSSESVEAGAKYILMAALSSGVMLFGISLLYGATGTLYFADYATLLNGSSLQLLALVFFLAGMAFKISLVPFHLWAADVYQGAPASITGFLSVISKGAAVFALMTVLYKVFPDLWKYWEYIVYAMIIVTITVGNLFAMRQTNLKRFLAFSSISQAGYIMMGVLAGTSVGMSTVVYFVLVYVVANLGIFGILSLVESKFNKSEISDYNGFFKTNPLLSIAFMLFLFSLAGIPPFAGFFSKFFIFMAAAEMGYYTLVFIALINTVISLYYYLLVVKAMFISPNDNPIPAFKSDNFAKFAFVICLVGTLLVGLANPIYDFIQQFGFGM